LKSPQVWLGLVFGAIGLTLAFWGVSLADLGDAFRSMQLLWLLPIGVVFMLQQVLRASRQLILTRPLAPTMTWRNSFSILCISFFFINTLPARLGELLRPALFWEREEIPLGAGFGVVFIERLLDLLFTLIVLWMVIAYVPLQSEHLPFGGQQIPVVEWASAVLLRVVPAILASVAVLWFFGGRIVSALERWGQSSSTPRVSRFLEFSARFAATFVESLDTLRDPRRLFGVLGYTFVIWTMTGVMYVWLAIALGIEDLVGYGEGMGVLVITMLATALPAPPGFAGVYEAAARGALLLFGVAGGHLDAVAVAFALVIHWWQFTVQATSAFYFLWVDGLSMERVKDLMRRARTGELAGG